jgi:acetyltransferase-like isoleucine patch superfamily enzyme
MKYFLVVGYECIAALVMSLPRFRLLNRIKSQFLRTLMGAKIGRRVVFYSGVWISTGQNLTIGDDVDLAKGVIVTTKGGVTIGNRVLVGYRTQILSSNHHVPGKGSRR